MSGARANAVHGHGNIVGNTILQVVYAASAQLPAPRIPGARERALLAYYRATDSTGQNFIDQVAQLVTAPRE